FDTRLGLLTLGSVPNIIAASIAVSFLGFFMGPYFATVSLCQADLVHVGFTDPVLLTGHLDRFEAVLTRYPAHSAGVCLRFCPDWRLSLPYHYRARCLPRGSRRSTAHVVCPFGLDGCQLAVRTETKGERKHGSARGISSAGPMGSVWSLSRWTEMPLPWGPFV